MSDVQLRDEVMTLYLAGHETTANTLSWIWHELSRNSALRAKLEAELATVLQGRTPVMDDLRALPYTSALIEETLRMYPAAWMFARVAREDVEIRGHLLPKGAQLWISPYVVQHDPRWYDAPEMFDPERWLDGRTANLHKHAFFPFGGGPRICIGNSFARMESALLLATICQRFRLHVIDPSTIALDPLITLRPKNGIKVRVEARAATVLSGAAAQPEFALPAV
jgi:cytochrome P450